MVDVSSVTRSIMHVNLVPMTPTVLHANLVVQRMQRISAIVRDPVSPMNLNIFLHIRAIAYASSNIF